MLFEYEMQTAKSLRKQSKVKLKVSIATQNCLVSLTDSIS